MTRRRQEATSKGGVHSTSRRAPPAAGREPRPGRSGGRPPRAGYRARTRQDIATNAMDPADVCAHAGVRWHACVGGCRIASSPPRLGWMEAVRRIRPGNTSSTRRHSPSSPHPPCAFACTRLAAALCRRFCPGCGCVHARRALAACRRLPPPPRRHSPSPPLRSPGCQGFRGCGS